MGKYCKEDATLCNSIKDTVNSHYSLLHGGATVPHST